MSVSDPLLKILKAHILRLHSETDVVTDYNPVLYQLCDTIEHIFRKGLKKQSSLFGLAKKDYFSWIHALPDYFSVNRISPLLTYAISAVKESKQVRNIEGRGKLYIRYGLQRKSLDTSIIYLRRAPILIQQWYDPAGSILADDILSEIFLSLLQEIKRINFRLRLEIQSFLDETWIIPVMRRFEFPPTKSLGIEVRYVDGRAITTGIQDGSAAADRSIEIGDVLDQLFDISLNGVTDGKIPSILRDVEGYPIYLNVVKAQYINGRVFPPIAKRLATLGMDIEGLEARYAALSKFPLEECGNNPPSILSCTSTTAHLDRLVNQRNHVRLGGQDNDDLMLQPVQETDSWATYLVRFLGKGDIGNYGGVKVIESSIGKILTEYYQREQQTYGGGGRYHHPPALPPNPLAHLQHLERGGAPYDAVAQWHTHHVAAGTSPFSSASSLSTAPSSSSSTSSTFVVAAQQQQQALAAAAGPLFLDEAAANSKSQQQQVLLQLGEAQVVVRDLQSHQVLWRHSYTEVSSCGRRVKDKTIFAYIAGETTCSLAEQFLCYVFEAKADDEAKTILCSIAQGFDRTHWLM